MSATISRAVGVASAGLGLTLLGGYALRRRARETDAPQDTGMHVKAAVTIRRDRDELYELWRDMESYPRFMSHVREVRVTSGGRSRWTARGPLKTKPSWEVVIADDIPSERISWRSPEGSKVDAYGAVRFVEAPADQGTEVHLELRYDVPRTIGTIAALMFGEHPDVQIHNDLRRFKQLVETGEIVRSDSTPEGASTPRLVKQRPAHPLADGELATVAGGRS